MGISANDYEIVVIQEMAPANSKVTIKISSSCTSELTKEVTNFGSLIEINLFYIVNKQVESRFVPSGRWTIAQFDIIPDMILSNRIKKE